MDKAFVRNIVDCYQNRNSSQTFLGYKLISKNLKKLSVVEQGLESLFNKNIGL